VDGSVSVGIVMACDADADLTDACDETSIPDEPPDVVPQHSAVPQDEGGDDLGEVENVPAPDGELVNVTQDEEGDDHGEVENVPVPDGELVKVIVVDE
jgi:hypothetical protein